MFACLAKLLLCSMRSFCCLIIMAMLYLWICEKINKTIVDHYFRNIIEFVSKGTQLLFTRMDTRTVAKMSEINKYNRPQTMSEIIPEFQ